MNIPASTSHHPPPVNQCAAYDGGQGECYRGGAVHRQGGDVTLRDPAPEPLTAGLVKPVSVIVILVGKVASNLRHQREKQAEQRRKPVEMASLHRHGHTGKHA